MFLEDLQTLLHFIAEKGNILGQDDAGWGEISSTLGEASVIGTDVVEGERVISEKGGWHGDPAAEAEFERRFGRPQK